MSFIKGTFSIVCDKCGKQHDFSEDDADFDATSGGERQMGNENGYSWETEFNCDNPNCGNEIGIEYEVWEYPEGSFNNDSIKVNGASVKKAYGYDFQSEVGEE